MCWFHQVSKWRSIFQCGYLHRDIKPPNFAIGREEDNAQQTIFILDFGLCRRYRWVTEVCIPRWHVELMRSRSGYLVFRIHEISPILSLHWYPNNIPKYSESAQFSDIPNKYRSKNFHWVTLSPCSNIILLCLHHCYRIFAWSWHFKSNSRVKTGIFRGNTTNARKQKRKLCSWVWFTLHSMSTLAFDSTLGPRPLRGVALLKCFS